MDCPECGAWRFKKTCKQCGYATIKPDKYPTTTGRTDTIVPRDCVYRMGEWRCQWGKYASDKEPTVYCPFHEGLMRHYNKYGAAMTGEEQWDYFQKERAWNQKNRNRHSWANPDGTCPTSPFWFKPEFEAWAIVTGLPVPHQERDLVCTTRSDGVA